ncbi:MAG TPA: HEPN domain-containing protein [Burkholderiaceae bacterium]|jgi:HEPN domain-containing protein|nr:HEPN domain-containing protein [Burkholderiaceae bacterium]
MSAKKELDPEQWPEAAEWLDRADDDLRAIEMLIMGPSPPLRSAALHCQQAAEKMAKASLVAFSNIPPKTHDLDRLGELVASHDTEIGELIRQLADLTIWYISVDIPTLKLNSRLQQTKYSSCWIACAACG